VMEEYNRIIVQDLEKNDVEEDRWRFERKT
jgi:hypothetical protein